MPNVKISAAADPGALLGTDMVPLARAGQATAYRTTMTEVATFASASAAAGLNNIGRNLLHNAYFMVRQRGIGAFTANGLTLDRWQTAFVNGTVSVAQVQLTDANRTAIGDEAAQQALNYQFTGSATAGSFHQLHQHLENVHLLAGKTVSVSFWAAASAALTISVNLYQAFGTGGSPSAQVVLAAQNCAITTAWGTRYSATFTLPSVSGKTLGTNGDDFTGLFFTMSDPASIGAQSGSVSFWGVQLEIGSVATQLEKLDASITNAQCQRFYQGGFARLDAYGAAGSQISVTIPYVVPMRGVPTLNRNDSGNVNMSSASITSFGAWGLLFLGTINATGGASLTTNWTASADL